MPAVTLPAVCSPEWRTNVKILQTFAQISAPNNGAHLAPIFVNILAMCSNHFNVLKRCELSNSCSLKLFVLFRSHACQCTLAPHMFNVGHLASKRTSSQLWQTLSPLNVSFWMVPHIRLGLLHLNIKVSSHQFEFISTDL